MKIKKSVLFVLLLLFISVYAQSKKQFFKLSRFIEPGTCSDCHQSIYNQWQNSMHALAHKDPLYRKFSAYLVKGLTDKDELAEAESCPKCHTPLGVYSGFPKKTSDDHQKTPELATHGVQCDFCHSSTGAYQQYNNGHIMDPGHGEDNPGTKRGPYKDSESDFHQSAYSKFHTSAYFCGSCHDVKHVSYGTVLETTFDEWKKSPYNSKDPLKRVPCQKCHMSQKPGVVSTGETGNPKNPGQAAEDGPMRDHVSTHYFVGANRSIPSLFGDRIRDEMARSRLQHAAKLTLKNNAGTGSFAITVKNSGAGHKLPTGLANIRQMWLEIIVRNLKGKILYSSGVADKNGYLPGGTIIYNTVFGDGKGKPVFNIARAKEVISDRRILPKQSLTETISLKGSAGKKVRVQVRLLYRSASQRRVDIIVGKGKLVLPITEMEKSVKNMTL
jgi:hypothetical protein